MKKGRALVGNSELADKPYVFLKRSDRIERDYKPDLSVITGYSGHMICKLTALTPLAVNYSQKHKFSSKPAIPGSSLKGVIRSMAEFIGGGCISVTGHNAGKADLCTGDHVCITCDMFGRVSGRTVNKGKVMISEAKPIETASHESVRLQLYGPRKKRPGNSRKFYRHSRSGVASLRDPSSTTTLYPVKRGSSFRFRVDFSSLDARELAVLLYALFLEKGLAHKIGHGKPKGMGSVLIEREMIEVQSARQYALGQSGESIPEEVREELRRIKEDESLKEFKEVHYWGEVDVTPPQDAKPATPSEYKEIWDDLDHHFRNFLATEPDDEAILTEIADRYNHSESGCQEALYEGLLRRILPASSERIDWVRENIGQTYLSSEDQSEYEASLKPTKVRRESTHADKIDKLLSKELTEKNSKKQRNRMMKHFGKMDDAEEKGKYAERIIEYFRNGGLLDYLKERSEIQDFL